MITPDASPQNNASPALAHIRSQFHFTLAVPLHRAAPMFGPEGERCWAGEHWQPEFAHPQPGSDVEGAVFTVQHGMQKSIWVNTLFDLSNGRMQYVSFTPDALVSTVNVNLTSLDERRTKVEVTYVRTALSAAANAHVQKLANSDRTSGTDWQQAIQQCLDKQANSTIPKAP